MASKRARPEDYLQRCVVAKLRKLRRLHGGRIRFQTCQPEGHRSLWQQQHDKAMGRLERGAPELLIYDGRTLPGIMWIIELKAEKGRVSEAQAEWAAWLTDREYRYAVVRSVEELVALLG